VLQWESKNYRIFCVCVCVCVCGVCVCVCVVCVCVVCVCVCGVCVCVSRISYPAGKEYALCYIDICGLSGFTIFFYITLQKDRIFSWEKLFNIKYVF